MSKESKECVYDREIAPLMTRIIQICERAGIAMAADFELDPQNGDTEDPLLCTTIVVPETACTRIKTVAALLKPGSMHFVSIRNKPEGMQS